MIDGRVLPETHKVDLINDALRDRRHGAARGREVLARAFKAMNIPRDWIANRTWWTAEHPAFNRSVLTTPQRFTSRQALSSPIEASTPVREVSVGESTITPPTAPSPGLHTASHTPSNSGSRRGRFCGTVCGSGRPWHPPPARGGAAYSPSRGRPQRARHGEPQGDPRRDRPQGVHRLGESQGDPPRVEPWVDSEVHRSFGVPIKRPTPRPTTTDTCNARRRRDVLRDHNLQQFHGGVPQQYRHPFLDTTPPGYPIDGEVGMRSSECPVPPQVVQRPTR